MSRKGRYKNHFISAFGFYALGLLGAFITPLQAQVMLDETEVSIAQFDKFTKATGLVTYAEREGGMVFSAGWEVKPDWNFRTPYGIASNQDEPAVHITYDEASAYCSWRGTRLPTRDEWIAVGYTEQRLNPPEPFEFGKTYPYPTGTSPQGANCLGDCGTAQGNPIGKDDFSPYLTRGYGHARTGTTGKGVNGLYEMGANVWEWASLGDGTMQATMGGSWWYGQTQMRADYGATKPRDIAAVYIGFRCVK